MKTVKALAISAAVVVGMQLTGCATIFNAKQQPVTITSVPAGAEVVIDGQTVVTPAVVQLKGKSEYYLTANLKGYKTGTAKINGDVRIGSSVVGNIFSFGIIGMAVDFLGTGAAYKLDPAVTVNLQKED
jgi:hypothetical protein